MSEVATFLEQLTFWHWFILGCALVVLEILAPGIIFVWLGVAAFITGIIALLATALTWELEFLIFTILSVVSVFAGRAFIRRNPTSTDHPLLNRRGQQYVGRVFTLDEPIVNGTGKLRIDDTTWKVNGQDMDAGTAVKVTGTVGVILTVEAA
ncbi:MAG: NfeD family protein [Rhodospirillales bacterium]|jgi:membrane protein implicated in regulation of membrane protease activity